MSQPPSSALEHGYFVMAREGKIVRISVAEGINKELIQHYQQDIARELARLAGSHWGVHLVINGDVLMTPAATDRLIEESKHHKDLGRCGTAIELVNGRATSLIQRFWGQLYQQAGIPYCFVSNRQEAEVWLKQQIAAADSLRTGCSPE